MFLWCYCRQGKGSIAYLKLTDIQAAHVVFVSVLVLIKASIDDYFILCTGLYKGNCC